MMSVYDQMNEQTKQRIEETFLALMSKSAFSKISVRDITTTAAINRGTFYLHFTDKYELLEKIECKLLKGLAKACADIQPEKVLQEARSGTLSQFSMQVFHYIDRHALKFRVLLSSHNQSGFVKRLQRFFIEQFSQKYSNHRLAVSDPQLPVHYLAAFAASAFLGVIEEWLMTEAHESPEQIAEYFVRIILTIQNYN